MAETMNDLTQQIENDAVIIDRNAQVKEEAQAREQEAYDGFSDTNVKLIPNPNFSDCQSVGTLLPINMASETITNVSAISEVENLAGLIKNRLGYSSKIKVCQAFSAEQVDALALAIKSFEKGNAFILGDMAGIGKGRVCAGVMRYAYMRNMIPVFITQKPYLFNDIYRDFVDIEGIGSNPKAISILPKPLVLHKDGVIIKPNGTTPINTEQGYRTIATDDEVRYTYIDAIKDNSINEICRRLTEEMETTGNLSLGKDFNCVMLPYSVISQGKGQIRRNFLKTLAPNALFVFDESHNAASANASSNILKHSLTLVQTCKGVLFSSATFAKNPNVFGLYVVKTSLRNAVPSLEAINDALKVGGENVSEYIASGLCKEGQMIRRERSFSDCEKITEYVGTIRRVNQLNETSYEDILDDTQKEFFDEAISYFRQLRDFSISQLARAAVGVAVLRAISQQTDRRGNPLQMADIDGLNRIKLASREVQLEMQTDWIRANRNKWIPKYESDSINRYKATFRTNLFLAVKAKYSADKVIECLNTPVNYNNVDDTTGYAPMKPIIAVANTGETIFSELQLKDGDRVRNDFSVYLQSIYRKLFVGRLTLRKVDDNYFRPIRELEEEGILIDENILRETEWQVNEDDFSDGGEEIRRIQALLDEYNSSLPFSIIDYIRDRVESTPRADVYFENPVNRKGAKYGSLSSQFYTFQEGTARSHMLVKDGDEWIYRKNNRIRNTSTLFKGFNNGVFDVMLINVVASTGGSAHSSLKEGQDVRPRNMFIVQFELDVNIEVQKRGRVNRTGQMNFPTYTYIITKIPAERRQYLMLRKKLRKLDANTSADQTASSKTAEMTDFSGREIHDIFNKYGYDVFITQFITDPNNSIFDSILREMNFRQNVSNTEGEAEQNDIKVEQFNAFIRELELYPCAIQDSFFNQMNELYDTEKANLIASGEYQEELRPKNYKASLKQRVVRQINSGESVFSLPLFLTDYYTFEDFVPWSRERVIQKSEELAVWEGNRVSATEFWVNLNRDFNTELSRFRDDYERVLREEPFDRSLYSSDEAFEAASVRRELKIRSQVDMQTQGMVDLQELIAFFEPLKPVRANLGGGLIEGMFVGYKIKDTGTRFKYSKSNIEFQFCFLSLIPTITLPYTRAKPIMDETIDVSGTIFFDIDNVRRWVRDTERRIVRRFYTGNILSGIVQANNDKQNAQAGVQEDLSRRPLSVRNFFLSRFTNIDGSITTAVELDLGSFLTQNTNIVESNQPLAVAVNSDEFRTYITQMPYSNGYELGENNFPIWNIANDYLYDRAIVAFNKTLNINNETIEVVEFEIVQSALIRQNKDTKVVTYEEREVGKDMYNVLYYDTELLNRYSAYNTLNTDTYVQIGYAKEVTIIQDKKTGVPKESTRFSKFRIKKKVFAFALETDDGLDGFIRFARDLYEKYEISFSFRSNFQSYYNVESKRDEYERGQKDINRQLYPEGEYEYSFIRNISDKVFQQIPNVIERTPFGSYGGVKLSKPLPPNALAAYEMKPLRIPNEILIKLATSVLDSVQKADFMRELESLAVDKSNIEIGDFVRRFLTKNSVPIIYFFGDLRGSDYGRLFKEYALKGDIQSIIFETKTEEESIKVKPKEEMTLDDVEDFLLNLLKII